MGMKYSFKQILSLMSKKQTYMRGLSVVLTMIMALQLVVVPVGAAEPSNQGSGGTVSEGEVQPVEPKLKNTYALVVATGGQSGESIQYFKVVYEDTDGIRRSEYILRDDSRDSFTMAREYSNRDARLESANRHFNKSYDDPFAKFQAPHELDKPLQSESRDTYLFETVYDVERIIGLEIMQNAGQWDCQGLWLYQVDEILGEEMYGYVSEEGFINFSGWRLAELEMTFKNGRLIYTTLQTSRPKLYRMGEEGHPEYNLIIYEKSEAKYEGTNTREYAMRLDITDVYGAGADMLYNSHGVNETLDGAKFKNILHMSIRYQDTFGCVQTVKVPVFPSGFIWALDNGVSTSTKLAGYAQQGDTLLFPVTLPFFADLLEVGLHYEGVEIETPVDDMNISSISMYDLALSLADVGVDEDRAAIVPTITYNPIYLWTTSSRQGYVLTSRDTEHTFDLRLNEDNLAIVDEPIQDEYLVEITTDDMPSAATTSDISVILNYVTYGGEEQRTEKIMLREQSKDFHGYTPGADDMYYWLGMRPGGKLYFRIKIPYVSQFTGATFALENGGNDEWQMGDLKIYRLDDISEREITWGKFSVEGLNSDRYYDRTFSGVLAFSGTRSLLVQKGDPATVDTSEGGGAYSESALPDSSVAWGDIKYSMNYEEALQNLGFTTTRNTYQVEVTVAGNTALAGTEDAGSKNQFYFQLIFEDGTSGYVLANQQLSGDGFRSGFTETFTVKTNQDYGELSSIRIIPEDISSKSDQFDKLNIESIQVMRRSDGGLSRQWSLERVGWIDIDYRDEGAASGMFGQSGRTEAEMARGFSVTYSTYAVNMLVSITTLAMPFSGTVYGDMCYYNSAGEVKHKGFDIVQLMYEYANKSPRYKSNIGDGIVATAGSAWSDSYMFRADRTDRFIITLSDVRELAYLELNAYMEGLEEGQGGTWHLGGVAVSLIESEGNLLLNANDEYERDNTVRLLTSNVDTNRIPAYQLLMEPNAMTSQKIYFMENKINLDMDQGNASVLAREPISQNDELNIYVYPNLDESEPSANYTLKAAATYTSPRGMRQASAGDLHLSSDGTMFYMVGVKAPGMTVLNELALQADNPSHIPVSYIERAIVQQVRSGVIINTYEIDYRSAPAAYGLQSGPVTDVEGYESPYLDEQVVMISIGEGLSEPQMLEPETKDMAVALSYIPEYTSESNTREYDSPFIFLTDQEINKLRSGQVVSLTFTEDYIKEITGVVLVATGGLTIPVDMACVKTYRTVVATGERVELQQYGFSEFTDRITGTEVGRTDRQLGYTGDSVKLLKLQFTTAPAVEDMESGVKGAVELTISYVDDYGTVRTKVIPDLRTYATTSSPFATDTVTDVELLVAGMKELRWLMVRPYDDREDTNLSWRLSSASAQLGLTGEVQKRSVDDQKAILESTGRKINFSEVSVQVNVAAYSSTGGATHVEALNETASIYLDSGRNARLQVTVNGSEEGFTVKAERASDMEGSATADASNYLTQYGDTLVFTPDKNYTGANIYYRITITSVEVGAKTVIVIVQNFEKEPEPVVMPSGGGGEIASNPGTAGDSGADSESGDASGTEADSAGDSGSSDDTGSSSDIGSSADSGSDPSPEGETQ